MPFTCQMSSVWLCKNQTRVVPCLTRMLLYDWPLVLASYSIYMPPFDWLVTHLLLKFTCYTSIGSRVLLCLAYILAYLAYVSPLYWFLCQLICPVIYFKSRTNTLKISFAFLHFDQLPNSLDLLISLLHPRFYISSFW